MKPQHKTTIPNTVFFVSIYYILHDEAPNFIGGIFVREYHF